MKDNRNIKIQKYFHFIGNQILQINALIDPLSDLLRSIAIKRITAGGVVE